MTSVWKERRAGRFKVSFEVIQDLPDHALALMFGAVLIFRAEHCVFDGCVHYEGCCRLFDPVEEGAIIPWYRVEMVRTEHDDGLDPDYELVVERTDSAMEFAR